MRGQFSGKTFKVGHEQVIIDCSVFNLIEVQKVIQHFHTTITNSKSTSLNLIKFRTLLYTQENIDYSSDKTIEF